MKKHLIWLACVVGFHAHADNVLIVHGLSTTSELDTTQSNIDNWPVVCNAQSQHTITYADTPPASLSGFQQIWDIRFSDSSPLTPTDMSAYASALSAGTSLFLMGENDGFPTRNGSLFQFADQLGGGQLALVGVGSAQTVVAPLNTNGLTSVVFPASGVATAVNLTGMMGTQDDVIVGAGSAFVWPVGSLPGAPAGKLTMVLDVNFMMPAFAADGNGQLFANLCEFMVVPPTLTLTPDSASVVSGQSVAIPVLANDVAANDTLDVSTVSVTAPPTLGITLVDAATGAITYTANAGASGVDTFSYRVCLTNTPSICETSTVTVTVGAQAPVVARPVPAMGGWGIAALLGLMGWTATRRRLR